MSDDLSIVVDALCKEYTSKDGKTEVFSLKNVSFQLKKGDILGIVGHNGSGKSTLLKIMSNLVKPTSGSVTLNGSFYSILDLGSGFHPDLTGKENIELIGRINNKNKKAIEELTEKISLFSELGNFIDEPVKNYSQGMYLRLAFSLFINLDGEIIIIDEILSVGDAYFKRKCENAIIELSKMGKTLVIVSHDYNQINSLCNKCLLIEYGEVKMLGSPADIYYSYLDSVNKETREEIKDFYYEDKSIKLNNIFINNQKLQNRAELFVDEELNFNFNFDKKIKTDTIVFHIDLYTANNHLIVYTSNILGIKEENLNSYLKDYEGEVNLCLTMPSFFFNVGMYKLVFTISQYSDDIKQMKRLMTYEKGISLSINESKRSNLGPMNLAPIVTKFDWKIN